MNVILAALRLTNERKCPKTLSQINGGGREGGTHLRRSIEQMSNGHDMIRRGIYHVLIHSKSEDPDPNDLAKKFELSANLSENATKWPKNGKK